jgi:hypothetical protein
MIREEHNRCLMYRVVGLSQPPEALLQSDRRRCKHNKLLPNR